MTVPEYHSVRPVAVDPSRRRAPARNAEVRVNSDNDRGDGSLQIPNRPTFGPVTGARSPRSIAARPYRTHSGHLPPIEIP
jgi:hypothetical protein